MKFYFQEKPYSCGSSALRNCLLAQGVQYTEKTLRKYCNTTPEGTTSKGLSTALGLLNFKYKELYRRSGVDFVDLLKRELRKGRVCITLTDNAEHWIAIIGYYDKRFTIIDSLFKGGKAYLTTKELCDYCRNFYRETKKVGYYTIILWNEN
jgi:ABC-type bacteriocin/lantibiotic exporter with double-glycine peptidase domain